MPGWYRYWAATTALPPCVRSLCSKTGLKSSDQVPVGKKAVFLVQAQIRSFPHDNNNRDFIILRNNLVCFQNKNPGHESSDTMTQRAAKPSSREGESLEVLEVGMWWVGKQLARADTCRMHTGNGHCGAPGTAQAAVGSTHRTETLESCGVSAQPQEVQGCKLWEC